MAVRTILKIVLFLALVVGALEFTMKGERRAFGGLLVKMGLVKGGSNKTLKERIEGKMDRVRAHKRDRRGLAEEASE